LVLGGGSGSEPFKHEPPAGYHGVGEAVLEAVMKKRAFRKKRKRMCWVATESIDSSRDFSTISLMVSTDGKVG
jgi:hypothetical protein